MAIAIRQSTRFRRDVKRLRRQNVDLSELKSVVSALVAEEQLDKRYRDHVLVGDWRGFRECHIQPDWLLIYRIESAELQLARTGSHAELYG
ncbi:MAG: type II toxin-antitoxin system mRNA interferase toxin, RelE/StbE family [Anaerolineae bacterium]|nr:MAG: type II toxin-antitoxin system mRNA interferase toxin, RelE/StbE family [Anaerolineae bacterium]